MHCLRSVGGAALVLAWILAGCGPGVGGTGTGNDPGTGGLSYYGATPQPVCASPLAQVLGCGAGTPVPAAQLFAAGKVSASFDANVAVVDARCDGVVFSGAFGVTPDGTARFYGLSGTDPDVAPDQPAALEVQGAGDDVVLILQAADGRVLIGPLTLQRVEALPAPGC
jgi:hypothetical protein